MPAKNQDISERRLEHGELRFGRSDNGEHYEAGEVVQQKGRGNNNKHAQKQINPDGPLPAN